MSPSSHRPELTPSPFNRLGLALTVALLVVAVVGVALAYYENEPSSPADTGPSANAQPPKPPASKPGPEKPGPEKPGPPKPPPDDDERIEAPELDGGVEWLNCAGPIRMKDLKGKIVLLDFWTYCCINCLHIMPDLVKLEKKYPNELVVIGVHSAKFDGEKDSANIRAAILKYQVEHPVVNDANHKIWNAYAVRSWPTFWLIDPEGYVVGRGSGEGLLEPLEQAIDKLIKVHREKKTLNEKPIRFDLAKFQERKTSPLYFPAKLHADGIGKRLFIADSAHHRIVITDLNGKKLDVAGTGDDGLVDGPFEKARFNDPHGLAVKGDTLYVADRKNHVIRALDLKARTVRTVAGTGEQGQERRVEMADAGKVGLNSPWDLLLLGDELFIAMAGNHQIWKFDIKTNKIGAFAGNGREDIGDGTLRRAMFAQPSGLATDGNWLYVADSEVSAVRAVSLRDDGVVKTIVGEGLFDFGDEDGVAEEVRLQHCLAVAFHGGKVYVADTYNNKIKVLDPAKRRCDTFLGDGKLGNGDDPPRFAEPAGLSVLDDKLYVADTNNHAVRVIDLKTKEVRTLKLEGLAAPEPPKVTTRPSFPNAVTKKLAEALFPTDGELTLKIKVELPADAKFSPLAPMQYLVETQPAGGYEAIGKLEKPEKRFEIKLPAEKLAGAKALKVSVLYHHCTEGGEGVCRVQSQIWEIPLRLEENAKGRTIHLTSGGVETRERPMAVPEP